MTPLEIFKILNDKGYESYYVGGFVRDMVRNVKASDIDIVTKAKPEEIISLFPNQKVDLVGKSFGVVIIDGTEVSTFRKDRYFGLSDKNVKIEYSDNVKDDIERRDLTINAILYNPLREEIFDYVDGMEDLKYNLIKFVGNADERILEDPNRILRACRFKALLNGYFEEQTYFSLLANNQLLDYVSPERISIEIKKAMKIQKASVFFDALNKLELLEQVFPSLADCVGESQNRFHKEDIMTHCMTCGDSISTKYPMLKLAGYLHDVGKPLTKEYNEESKDYQFLRHEIIGAEIVKPELVGLRFSNDEIDYICNVIELHMSTPFLTDKATRKSMMRLKEAGISVCDSVRFKIADRKAKVGIDGIISKFSVSELREMLSRIEQVLVKKEPFSLRDLTINGNDVMEIMGIEPGPKVGFILKHLFEIVLNEPERNNYDELVSTMKATWPHIIEQGGTK